MAFERNDIVFDSRLMAALGDSEMGFDHNDIVTVDRMNAAIAAGGGGGGGLTFVPVTWDDENFSFVMTLTFAQLMAGMASGTLYAVNIDSTLIPEGWSFSPQVFLIYGLRSDGNYTQMETGCSYSWYAESESDYPKCYIGD